MRKATYAPVVVDTDQQLPAIRVRKCHKGPSHIGADVRDEPRRLLAFGPFETTLELAKVAFS